MKLSAKKPVAASDTKASSVVAPAVTAAEGLPATLTVRRTTYFKGDVTGQDAASEIIEVPRFVGETAKVSVGMSYRKDLGNYEGVKFDIHVSLPCYPVDDEIEATYEAASEFVAKKLQDQLDAVGGEPAAEEAEEGAAVAAVEDDLAEAPAAADDAAEEEFDPDTIDTMDKDELDQFVIDYGFDVPANAKKKIPAYRAAVKAAALAQIESEQADQPPAEEDAAADFVPFTKADLQAEGIDSLRQTIRDWELDDRAKAIKGPPPKVKAALIDLILAYQVEMGYSDTE